LLSRSSEDEPLDIQKQLPPGMIHMTSAHILLLAKLAGI
jgi:hypothetical protein